MKNEATGMYNGANLADLQKRKRFFEEKRQLENKAAGLQRECNSVIFSKRSEFRKDFLVLEELNEQYNENEKKDVVKLKQQLMMIKTNVEKLQRSLTDVKPSPKFVEKLKEIMENIENSIMNFKKEQREKFEEMLHDERVIMQELTASVKKFDSWSRLRTPVVESTNALKKARNQSNSLPPAIAGFERFLIQTGGHTGGWEDFDHQEYLKLKQHNKFKVKDEFIRYALKSLPGKSFDDVRQHDDWYCEYSALLEKKKHAIQQWKQKKDAEKIEKISKVNEDDKIDENVEKKAKILEKERQERLYKLDAWKAQRELEKKQREEDEARAGEEALRLQEKEEKRRQELKEKVEEYARHREEEKQIMKMAERRRTEIEREKRRLDAVDISRLHQRNEKMLQERKMKMQLKEMENVEKERRLEKLRNQVEVHVERDPSRLLQLTEGLKERKKTLSNPQSNVPVVFSIPHRAVPSWRKG